MLGESNDIIRVTNKLCCFILDIIILTTLPAIPLKQMLAKQIYQEKTDAHCQFGIERHGLIVMCTRLSCGGKIDVLCIFLRGHSHSGDR